MIVHLFLSETKVGEGGFDVRVFSITLRKLKWGLPLFTTTTTLKAYEVHRALL